MSNTVESLVKECGLLALNDRVLCDNIDLDTIYLDYLMYYRVKFGRSPNISKRQEVVKTEQLSRSGKTLKKSRLRGLGSSSERAMEDEGCREKILPELELGESLVVSQCLKPNDVDKFEDYSRIRPTLNSFRNYTPEWAELASIICRYDCSKNLHVISY